MLDERPEGTDGGQQPDERAPQHGGGARHRGLARPGHRDHHRQPVARRPGQRHAHRQHSDPVTQLTGAGADPGGDRYGDDQPVQHLPALGQRGAQRPGHRGEHHVVDSAAGRPGGGDDRGQVGLGHRQRPVRPADVDRTGVDAAPRRGLQAVAQQFGRGRPQPAQPRRSAPGRIRRGRRRCRSVHQRGQHGQPGQAVGEHVMQHDHQRGSPAGQTADQGDPPGRPGQAQPLRHDPGGHGQQRGPIPRLRTGHLVDLPGQVHVRHRHPDRPAARPPDQPLPQPRDRRQSRGQHGTDRGQRRRAVEHDDRGELHPRSGRFGVELHHVLRRDRLRLRLGHVSMMAGLGTGLPGPNDPSGAPHLVRSNRPFDPLTRSAHSISSEAPPWPTHASCLS